MQNKNIQILSIEAKDLITKRYEVKKHPKFTGSLDDSIEVDKLRDLNKKIIKYNSKKKRYYSNDIITVTFEYSCKHNKDLSDEEFERVEQLEQTLSIVKKSKQKKEIKELLKLANRQINKKTIRNQIYKYGFNIIIDGKLQHFVRYKRSSGSARVGKCLFINDKYYKKMIDWSFAGIEHKENTEMDCSSMEAYISLPTSSCIDRFYLEPKNILLIEDGESTFTDTVMATRFINEIKDENGNVIDGDLDTNIETTKITNKIWDGESILDKSIFIENGYEDRAILQIRNRFFKGIGINTDIQKFFNDNNITEISQLNGKTIATDIKDIKLITTPSSVKYLKYGTFENWLKHIVTEWGICKYEKPQHHFNKMVQTHYQLINTLGMTMKETEEFLNDSVRYINYLKNDTTVLKYHLGMTAENYKEDCGDLNNINNSSDFILQMLERNDDFIKTKICSTFKRNLINSYISNIRKGHVLVNGNYSVVVSCPYEYLLQSIGKWNGDSILRPFECVSNKFDNNSEILAVRSPQPTMSNMCVFKNTKNDIINKYFNTNSNEVIYISSINNNVCELQSSMDFDGDAVLLTDNKYILMACKRLNEQIKIGNQTINRFLVPTDFTPKATIKRKYNWEDLSDVDIKCSSNKIGEIINLAQMLNSIYWDNKNNNKFSEKQLLELYKDICQLDILSCIEIDRCKKISPVNAKKELDKIRNKHYLKKGIISRNKEKKEVGIRPYFFKYLDGGKDYKFKRFECGMDYLEKVLDKNIEQKEYEENIPIVDLLIRCDENDTYRMTIKRLKDKVKNMRIEQQKIWSSDYNDKFIRCADIYKDTLESIKNIEINDKLLYSIFDRIHKSSFDEKYLEYKSIGKPLLHLLFDKDKKTFLKSIKVKKNISLLSKNLDGDIDLYGLKFSKIE